MANLKIDKILSFLSTSTFAIPLTQQTNDYFPSFLSKQLNKYLTYYSNFLKPVIDDVHGYIQKDKENIVSFEKLDKIISALNGTIKEYYSGNVYSATGQFNLMLESLLIKEVSSPQIIEKEHNFYRTRFGGEKHLTRPELFHNPFDKRHLVNTNRYSIPGFPALYFGSSVYVCWEEYNKPDMNKLYFSRFSNVWNLKVIKIQRLAEFLETLPSQSEPGYGSPDHLDEILRYLALFPLFIACSIKTSQITGSFKPEYIIPQMLLQYIATRNIVDGIMFPSTKVNYASIKEVRAYNYVFPVKAVSEKGYCSELINIFSMTEPTSLESEALMNYSRSHQIQLGNSNINIYPHIPGTIRLVEGVDSSYATTAFGSLELIINSRKLFSSREFND
ncbi:hypothetical protein [Hymenobacter sp. BT559]|uniref:hypothetical protein n=1 Tax=Hymenobacter sp. BT559 TaxID=2795729 RepID=UPI0018ED6700|nr:hypothetical protein [Hymenobacter sp. BT559]MBJ6142779.1 hypothetical protein [Hymenobacter sp. BT559]